jgi:predicted dehydrogenase
VHNLDVANWFLGSHPVAAVGFGARARRRTGDQFGFFSIDYEYPDGVHIHSMCRQVTGCWNRVGERLVGEKGWTSCSGKIKATPEVKVPKVKTKGGPYMQEHYDLLESILKGQPLNEAQNVAEATMAAVMGRISAYTGQRVKWDEVMKSDLHLKPTPEDFETGNVVAPKDDVVAIPGKA